MAAKLTQAGFPLWITLVLILVASLFLGSCGDSNGDTTTTATVPSSELPFTATSAPSHGVLGPGTAIFRRGGNLWLA